MLRGGCQRGEASGCDAGNAPDASCLCKEILDGVIILLLLLLHFLVSSFNALD